jgi:ABC-type sugar transport system permease subunit
MGFGSAVIALLVTYEQYLLDVWPLSFYVFVGIGGLYGISGLCGVISSLCIFRSTYRSAVLLLYSLATACTIIAFVLLLKLKDGSETRDLLTDWNTAVQQDTTRLCRMEEDLNCSGWAVPCDESSINLSMSVYRSLRQEPSSAPINNVTQRCPTCHFVLQNIVIAYNTTCSSALQARVSHDFVYFIVVVVVTLFGNVGLACFAYVHREGRQSYGTIN